MKRLSVYFNGRVQGVGFRFSALSLSKSFPLTGFVRNLEDGRVEIVAEGREQDLEEYLETVRQSPLKHYISGTELAWSEATGEFKVFEIRA